MPKLLLSALLLAPTLAQSQTWSVLARDGGGRAVAPYLSSLAGGEAAVGVVRSDALELDAGLITFEICGHDGHPGNRQGKSLVALCDAETDAALRSAPPPAGDAMVLVQWDVVELIGRRVYFRAVDAVSTQMFAWFGIRNVRIGDRELMPDLQPGELPLGWREEAQPENVSVDEWLHMKTAGDRWAFEDTASSPTWGVLEVNGARQDCAPYLSSLRGGEQGTGAVRSPAFTLETPAYTFLAMGADAPTGDAGLNWFQLVDAETLEVLRRSEPPVGNTLAPITWETGDLVGRRVFFRAADGNGAPSWAWLGCDQIPLDGGRLASCADPESLTGFREESQPDGTPIGGRPAGRGMAEMVEDEWRLEDVRRGVRWPLWRGNAKAAPWIMSRLVRIMEADFDRADSLRRDFVDQGARRRSLADLRGELADLERRFAGLQASPADVPAWEQLRLEQRRVLRRLALRSPLLDFDRLLFVKRFTQQSYADINVNHHAWGSRPGGGICTLGGWRAGKPEVTDLLAGRLGPGNVHGIDLDWDAGRILFSYAQSDGYEPPPGWLSRQATFGLHQSVGLLHLYEMRADGSDLRQLTDGEWSDLNPCYLPSGDVAFESERCGFEINCNELDKDEPTTNLFTMRRDGSGIRRLAVTKDGDWYPRVLDDGSIVYSHWEYHERGLSIPHPLWLIRPDGTGADNFAKQHFDFPVTLTVPRPIPGSPKIIAIGTGHHTLAAGPVVLVDRGVGPNDPACLTRITGPDSWPEYGGQAPPPDVPGWRLPPGDGWYMDPYPLSETTFLAAYCDGAMQDETGYGLYLVDVYGGKELLYRDPGISSVMPIPLRPRMRPPVVADARGPGDGAVCVVTDVQEGIAGLPPGSVRSIRIGEPMPWPYSNETGGDRYEPDAKSQGVTWTPIRILGTVPIERDGSAYFHVPADTELYFQALDENGMELRRMRSYVSFQAGETRSCVGCHETRAEAPGTPQGALDALKREPSTPAPPPWGDKPLSFLRDIQPLLSRHCLRCHTGLKPSGHMDLSAGLTRSHNRAYDTLVDPSRGLLALASKGDNSRVTPVLSLGAHQSRLVQLLRTTHSERVSLADGDWRRLYTWLDANAPYHDGFIRKRPESELPYFLVEDAELWGKIEGVHQRRCAACHEGQALARPEWVDLDRPADSLFLAGPLAGAAGASSRSCDPAPYASASDPDYAEVLALVEGAVRRTWQRPRRDLRCLVPGRRAGVAAR